MKICWYDDKRLGLVDDGHVRDATKALAALPPARYPAAFGDLLVANLHDVREAIGEAAAESPRIPIERVKLLSPVANPAKIMAAPVNYQAHFDEAAADAHTFAQAHVRRIQETGLFLKSTSSLAGSSEPLRLIKPERRTDHEIELVAVIGRRGKDILERDALDYVAGYCIGLDITIRGSEERSLRKSADGYSVLGPWLVTADEIPDPHELDLWLEVNGDRRQHANTRDLILRIPELIAFASAFYTLYPGDVLFTGTPEGVGPIAAGDVVRAGIDHLGSINVHVS